MPIRETFVPSETPRVLRAEYRVEGDSPFRSYSTREAAEEREAELAGDSSDH
jgi:hypothetical protein